jgi:hypothetical protein
VVLAVPAVEGAPTNFRPPTSPRDDQVALVRRATVVEPAAPPPDASGVDGLGEISKRREASVGQVGVGLQPARPCQSPADPSFLVAFYLDVP